MKKFRCFLSIALTVLIVLSLAACSEGDQEESADVSLPEAAEKLKTADSYRLTMTMDNKIVQEQKGERKEAQVISTLTCVKTCDGGTTTINAERVYEQISQGQNSKGSENLYYFHGKEAYYRYPYGEITNKWVSDKDFDMAFVMDEVANMEINVSDYAVLEKIEQLSPAQKTDGDGTVSLELKNMNVKDFASVYALLGGDMNAEEIEEALVGDCKLHITVKVNKDGYLTLFQIDMGNVTMEDTTQDMLITFAIDQINAVSENPEPDIVKNFSVKDDTEYIQIFDGKKARYSYSSYREEPGFVFQGFGDRYDDSYTVSSYELLAEVEGKPVKTVDSIIFNGEVSVERLIIPVGVKLSSNAAYLTTCEQTTLFFMDKEENVEKNFVVAGGNGDGFHVKAAYYEGQWEMVNGIPTPKN